MSFNTPLTTPQINLLRSGHYEGQVNVDFFSNRVVFAGQVNTDLAATTTWAKFAYNNVTVGAFADVEEGMVIIIGTTNSLQYSAQKERLFRGRARLLPDASFVYTNISSKNIAVGAYFWVIDVFDITLKLSRPVGTLPSVVQKVDFDLDYQGLMPRVTGLRTIYAGDVDAVTGKLRLALSVTANIEQVGATISSYLYVFRSGKATVISGSLSSATVTVDIVPGETWGTLFVTQSDGVVLIRKFGIKARDASNPSNISFDHIQLKATWQQSYVATLPAFAGVDNIIPGTPAIAWRSNEVYGTTAGSLTDNNTDFIGWFVSETGTLKGDRDYSTLTDATFQLAGVGARLAYLAEQLLMIINDATPALWDHMINANIRRAVWHILTRHSTAGMLCDVNFDADNLTDNYRFPYLPLKGSNILAVCNALLAQVNGALEFAPDGRIFACRDGQYIASPASLPVIANYTAADGPVYALTKNYDNSVGKVDADGACWNSGALSVQALISRAPGIAQGEAQGAASLKDQILIVNSDQLSTQAEIDQRVGTEYEVKNLTEELTIDHGDGYTFPIPSKSELYTFTIDTTVAGPNGIQRIIYDTTALWFCKSVDANPVNDGTRKVRATYRRLVLDADPGDVPPAVPVVPVTIGPLPPIPFPSMPDLPPFPDIGMTLAQLPPGALTPPKGKITFTDGRTVAQADVDNAYITQTFGPLTNPQWSGITPTTLGDFLIQQVLFDPLGKVNNTCGLYILANDGTDSCVWFAPNALATPPLWLKGNTFSGVYTVIRGTNTAGTVLVMATADTVPTSVNITYPASGGTGPASVAINEVFTCSFSPNSGNYYLELDLDQCVTLELISYNAIPFSSGGNTHAYLDCAVGPHNYSGNFVSPTFPIVALGYNSSQAASTATFRITSIEGSGNAKVRKSVDRGINFGSAVNVGATPGLVGGFDIGSASETSYVGIAGALYRATTYGGAYSSWAAVTGNVVACIVPYFRRNGLRQTTASNPDVIAAKDNATGGGLLWFDGAAATSTDITPVAGMIFDNANCVTVFGNNHIAAFGKVSGVYKLYISTDAGVTWALVESPTNPHFIRGLRGDRHSFAIDASGDLYNINGGQMEFSSIWADDGMKPRTVPNSGVLTMDIYG